LGEKFDESKTRGRPPALAKWGELANVPWLVRKRNDDRKPACDGIRVSTINIRDLQVSVIAWLGVCGVSPRTTLIWAVGLSGDT